MKLTDQQIATLKQSLNFLHVEELRDICTKFAINNAGKKGQIILRILHFLKTGEVLSEPKIPAISCGRSPSIIDPDQHILKGSYKNDLRTRIFFKNLIGDYFHFTAFGIDWINERWFAGDPPTYKEFADMWVKEYARRKKFGTTPKDEWAYINFVQQFIAEQPNASSEAILEAWNMERKRNVEIVKSLLQ
jgi:hypothetical protein